MGREPTIGAPVIGSLVDGVGLFTGEDRLGGLPILVKTRYSDITPASLRWEQAFFFDRGLTYETNWIMAFERRPEPTEHDSGSA